MNDIVVVGAGCIGSWLSLLLTKEGYDIILFDNDRIECHNLKNQLYKHEDLGLLKTQGIQNVINEFCRVKINTFNERVTSKSLYSSYMISAVDNMESRKIVFDLWCQSEQKLLIDGRLHKDQLQIFCVMPKTSEKYKSSLYEDKELPDEKCEISSHLGSLIASHMVNFLNNYQITQKLVPYYFEYYLPLNLTTIKE